MAVKCTPRYGQVSDAHGTVASTLIFRPTTILNDFSLPGLKKSKKYEVKMCPTSVQLYEVTLHLKDLIHGIKVSFLV